MKKRTKKSKHRKRNKNISFMDVICWLIIPPFAIVLLVLDGLGLYCFNTLRLIIVGGCVLVALFPFFSEISLKDFSLKRDKDD